MEPLTLPGNLESLTPVRDYVKAAAALAGLDKKVTYRLMLAVDEVATNVVVHGYEEAGLAGPMTISAEVDTSALVIILEDVGVEYDDSRRGTPDDLDKPIEEREIGGLGVFLAVEGVDEYKYKRVDGKNRRTFVIKRTAGG
ncbi:MAG: anti-sigma regulatory factor [Deltaproteobacteria bacterium]|nr:anti-sigma regulatory factor [Deltaproteobacteria bacterium]